MVKTQRVREDAVGQSRSSVSASATVAPVKLASRSRRVVRARVAELQRERLLVAATDVAEEGGYASMTIARIIARALVSRKTFYDVFSDREDCFAAVLERVLDRACVTARSGYAEGKDWRESVRLGLSNLLVLMDEEPSLARLWVVDAMSAPPEILEWRVQILEQLASFIDEGSAQPGAKWHPPALIGEAVVGGIMSVLYTRLRHRSTKPLADLLGPLMYLIVLPYLGPAAAARELDRPTPRSPRPRPARRPARREDPLEGLNMRLTYRTVLVLAVVSAQPGANNRQIAEGSGVIDQGQISKLLSRLTRLGLIENNGWGHAKGAANSWQLTPLGEKVVRATRPAGHVFA